MDVFAWARRAWQDAAESVATSTYLRKWLFLGALIGIIAGLGAVVFYWLLSHATGLLLTDIGGYSPPTPSGEGGRSAGGIGFSDFSRPWAIPLVVGGGALVSGLIVFTIAPDAEGHGTDAAIRAMHRNPRQIGVRVVVVKIIASAITIGSGGSGGREGPTGQISAGFGSLLTRLLHLRPGDGRIAVGVGIGSGIGAIFGAPLGGAVLAASIGYKNDSDDRILVPGIITSVVAYAVYGSIEGYRPLFGYAASQYRFDDAWHLVWFAVIGVLAGVVGLVYSRTFYGFAHLTKRLPGAGAAGRIAKCTVGGLLVGLLALAIPQVLGSGYGWAQMALDRAGLLSLPLWMVLILPLAKILATSLSIGTGGSGGIFGPGIVIGAFTGGAVWRLLEAADAASVPQSPAPFVIVGMMACFGSIARVPLAVMLMVAEMTGSYTVLVPAMLAVGLAYLIVRRFGDTIYSEQVDSRETDYATRVGAGLPLLDRVPLGDVVHPAAVLVRADAAAVHMESTMRSAGVDAAPATDGDGRFAGVARLAGGRVRVDRAAVAVDAGGNLADAVECLLGGGNPDGWVTVIGVGREVCGVVGVPDVVRGYRAAVSRDAQRFHRITGAETDVDVVDVHVAAGSEGTGWSVTDSRLPDSIIVLSVLRGRTVLPEAGNTVLEAGDVVTALGTRESLGLLRASLTAGRPASDLSP